MATSGRFAPFAQLGRRYRRLTSPVAYLARHFLKTAAALVVEDASVCLDIGAGTAPYAEEIRTCFRSKQYIAADVAPNERTDLVADGCALPLPLHSIDLVVGFDVIQHVATPELMLDEIARLAA